MASAVMPINSAAELDRHAICRAVTLKNLDLHPERHPRRPISN